MKLLLCCAAAVLPGALSGQEQNPEKINYSSFNGQNLVITEIMADPDPPVGLPNAEYVEIMNNGEDTVNLAGWYLFEGSNRVLPSVILLPREYLIVCANSDTSKFSGLGKIAGVSSMSLTNTGEKISIRSPQGIPVDSVTYSDSWYNSSFKKDGGWSLERIDPRFTCSGSGNWKASINPSGGTPGTVNSVSGTYTDTSSPEVLRAYCADSVTLMVLFSEPMDPVQLVAVTNYSVTPLLTIISASPGDASNMSVSLRFASQILSHTIYELVIANVTDCAGNIIQNNSRVKFGMKDSIPDSAITINEILFNPNSGGYDFVEIQNIGNGNYDVSDLRVVSLNLTTGEPISIKVISSTPWLLFPGDYLVLTESPEAVASQYHSSYPRNFVKVDDLPSMNVDAGHIAIWNGGRQLDAVRYSEDDHFALLENVKGVSLEKINPKWNSMDPVSWHSASPSAGFATPGYQNSVFIQDGNSSGNVRVEPRIFSPDQDGIDDIVTFSVNPGTPGNIMNLVIYNAGGQVIFQNDHNRLSAPSENFSWDGLDNDGNLAFPGIYLARIEIFNLNGTVRHYLLPFVLAVRF